MNIDDRPTTDLRANSHILQKFQMSITLQHVNRCLVLGGVFGMADRIAPFPVGSNPRWPPAEMAAGGHLGKLQMAKSLKRNIEFTVCMYAVRWRFKTYFTREGH